MSSKKTNNRSSASWPALVSVALWLALVSLVGCDKKTESAVGACKPSCDSTCGVDDGCGGSCGCPTAMECRAGQCVADDCGPCKANETCVGGQCVCTPQCEGNGCLDDGCGGTCPCPSGHVTDANGKPVPPEDCHDTCASAGFTCGSVCGETCGTCGKGETCHSGSCECQPVCDGTSCSDGCGGLCECAAGTVCDASSACVPKSACRDTCESAGRACGDVCGESCGTCADGLSCVVGQCREALNCKDCSLKFSLLSKVVENGHIREAVLALDYEPTASEPRPRLADLRLDANRKIELVEVEEGNSVSESGKKLFFDETTKRNFQRRADGSYQIFAYGVSDVDTLVPGRIATLRFKLDELGPVSFSLSRRAQIFAPPGADAALQSTTYDQAVVVSR